MAEKSYTNKEIDKLMKELFDKFEDAKYTKNDIEYWYARDLQNLLGYNEWRNFTNVIQKSKESCENSGHNVFDHFVDVNKMVKLGSGSEREIDDIILTRYACYLIAQNGNPQKHEIAFAQTYFAMQTRKMELIQERIKDLERLNAREKLRETEKRLSKIVYERGFEEKDFGYMRSKGDKALFGGYTTKEMKKKLGVPGKEPLADYADQVIIKGKDFAAAMTAHNTEVNNLYGVESITNEHVINNKEVRKALLSRNIYPEKLPPQRDIKLIERDIQLQEKKLSELKPEPNITNTQSNQIHRIDISKELWKIALLIMTIKEDGSVTTKELIDEIPKYIEIPNNYQEISETKQEPKYIQIIRNLKSNQKNKSSFVSQGYAESIENGFKITNKGIDFVKNEFAKFL